MFFQIFDFATTSVSAKKCSSVSMDLFRFKGHGSILSILEEILDDAPTVHKLSDTTFCLSYTFTYFKVELGVVEFQFFSVRFPPSIEHL